MSDKKELTKLRLLSMWELSKCEALTESCKEDSQEDGIIFFMGWLLAIVDGLEKKRVTRDPPKSPGVFIRGWDLGVRHLRIL